MAVCGCGRCAIADRSGASCGATSIAAVRIDGLDGTLRLWNVATGARIGELAVIASDV